MTDKQIAEKLEHYLNLYAMNQDQEALWGMVIYTAMLVGRKT